MKKIDLGESYIYENGRRKFNRKPSLTQLVVRLVAVEHKPTHAHSSFFFFCLEHRIFFEIFFFL
jgi:hypothetical protein